MVDSRMARQATGRDQRGTSLSDVPSRVTDSRPTTESIPSHISAKPEFGFNGFIRGADSPPPLSDTVSLERTTEKKLSNLARKQKMAGNT
jgi:hypothetical protein